MLATAIQTIAVSYDLVCSVAVLADANFPTASVCSSGPEMVRADGETFVIIYVLSLPQQQNSLVIQVHQVPSHPTTAPICIAQ